MSAPSYLTLRPTSRPETEIEIKRSRFLGYAARVGEEAEARAFLADIRHRHPQARHVCHAFVLSPDRRIQRSSDDGEPSGTAGVPILEAIVNRQSDRGIAEYSDVVVAVVRYFGGIKLGAGGLVQAYSDTTAATLDVGSFVRRSRMEVATVHAPHESAGRFESELRSAGFHLKPTSYGASGAMLTLAIADDDAERAHAREKIAALSAGKATITVIGNEWIDEEN